MKNTALLCLLACVANAAIFTSFSNDPAQPNNIWNQPGWNQQGWPSYTPPSSPDNTNSNDNQTPQDAPVVDASANPEIIIKSQYAEFKLKNGKSYGALTDSYRLGVFAKNVKSINAHNAVPGQSYQR